MVKFMLSTGIQLFGLKTTSQGKSDLKIWIFGLDLSCEVVFRPKNWITAENLNLTMLKTRLSLKTKLGLYLVLTLTRKKILKFFFQKIKSGTVPDHHVKGQPAASTYVREKGGVTFDTIRVTLCTKQFQMRARGRGSKIHILWVSSVDAPQMVFSLTFML